MEPHRARMPISVKATAGSVQGVGTGQPFRQYLLKIHSRCNLACDYCYMYEAADQSWRSRPLRMSLDTVRRAAASMLDQVRTHGLAEISVILHGGEPLLVGAEHLDAILSELSAVLAGRTRVRFALQTNGHLLVQQPALLPVLLRHGVQVAVSLDGTAASHDRHRRHPDGRGSHARTAQALRLLAEPAHRALYAGVLCAIDLEADPVETYRALLEFAPPRLDLLLPHGTWQHPPPGLPVRSPATAPPSGGTAAPYGEWLCAVFDRWYGAPRRETGIRLFEEIAVLLLGGRAASEMVGLAPADLVVVETDGAIEQSDSLKVAFDGAAATGLDVFRHDFTEAARHPAFQSGRHGLAGLGPVCNSCPLVRVCGGGLYAHRYAGETPSAGRGFSHPSVYCDDLALLIRHIHRRLVQDVTELGLRVGETAGV